MCAKSDSDRETGGAVPDGGSRDETFESVNWEEIDKELSTMSTGTKVWIVAVALWALGAGADVYSRFIADSGKLEIPLIGTVGSVTWLWIITLMIISYYGVIPLYKNRRMTMYYWREFRKNKAAVISGIYLIVIFLIGVVGSRVLPSPERQPGLESQPPAFMSTESYVVGVDCAGGFSGEGADRICHGSWDHPLGTTPSGEDILLAVIHGMEVSMQVGLIATLISITVAASIALTAAYYGGLVDEALMRYVDIQMTFPTFFLFLLLAYTIGGSLFILILIFGFFGWGAYARIMRAEALQRREEAYMKAAKSAGATSFWAIRRHLLPNVSNSLITAASLAIPAIILAEAALSFIGLGDPTAHSWGRIISEGQGDLSTAWWISTLPGFFLFFTVLAFNFLGDALRDALDPRHGGPG